MCISMRMFLAKQVNNSKPSPKGVFKTISKINYKAFFAKNSYQLLVNNVSRKKTPSNVFDRVIRICYKESFRTSPLSAQ